MPRDDVEEQRGECIFAVMKNGVLLVKNPYNLILRYGFLNIYLMEKMCFSWNSNFGCTCSRVVLKFRQM